jgi:hypothetical protein
MVVTGVLAELVDPLVGRPAGRAGDAGPPIGDPRIAGTATHGTPSCVAIRPQNFAGTVAYRFVAGVAGHVSGRDQLRE